MRALLPLLLLAACSSEPAPAPAPAQPAPAQPAPAPVAAERQTLPISAGKIDLVTQKNGDTDVPAAFETVSGDIRIDPADLAATTGTVTIQLGSWNSGLELRDDRVKKTFLGVEAHPTTTFELAGIDGASGPLAGKGAKATGTARGKLKWRAVEQELSVPVQLERTGDQSYRVTADTFELSIAALGMGEPLAALITECEHESVADAVRVTLDLALGDQPTPVVGEPTKAPTVAPPSQLVAPPRVMPSATSPEGPRTLKKPAGDATGQEGSGQEGSGQEGSGSRSLPKSDG